MANFTACIGCLSLGRKLTRLNEELRQILCEFLEEPDHQQPKSLCFECLAIVHRVMEFKKQVKRANIYLQGYMINPATKSLSKLELKNIFETDILGDVQSKDKNNIIMYIKSGTDSRNDNNLVKYENFDQKSSFDHDSDIFYHDSNIFDQESIKSDHKSCKINENNTEPLAFIKMEESNLEMDFDDQNEMDKSESKVKESAFSDSDDEPLTMKSKKYKKKRERKEKLETAIKRKREPPSGIVNDPRVDKKLRDLNVESGNVALVLLTWEEVQEERRLALQGVKFTRHTHRCTSCIVGYNHLHKLQEHNKKHSLEAGDEVCDICTIRCKTKAALASHKRRHRARWVCLLCGARYSQAHIACDHCARTHHGTTPTHRCPHCAHIAPSLSALRMHIKNHSARPECNLCGKTFRDKSSLRTHGFVHRGEKEHACSTCDKRFTFKKQKEIHELTHLSHQHLYCHQCDVSFKNQTSFYQHMKYSLKHIDPADIKHVCPICDKRFVKAKRLHEHNLAVHLKLAPIKCTVPDCTFACPSGAALRSHRRLVHGGARAIRNHVCHKCGNTYKGKKSLEGHLRSHNSVRQACPSGEALRSHRRLVHGGARAIRNHVCHKCGNIYKI